MRLTLEELKAMSDEGLYSHWAVGKFPFELAKHCSHCITMHSYPSLVCAHTGLIKEASRLGAPRAFDMKANWLRAHLEELYALRLFWDHLYPPAEAPAAPLEHLSAESIPASAPDSLGVRS